MKTNELTALGICIAAIATTVWAQTESMPPSRNNVTLYSFSLRDAPLDVALDRLQDLTGKSITVDLGITASVTISTPDKVTADEAVALITEALIAQGIRLENLDENTIRVRGTPKPKTPPTRYENGEAAMKRIAELRAQRHNGQQSEPITSTDFSYADRRRARMAAGDTNAIEPHISEADMQRHLADYQRAISNQGLPALSETTDAEQNK